MTTTQLDSHLDALINITRRFVTADTGLRARILRSNEIGNSYPLALVELLERADAEAIRAKGSLYQRGGVDPPLIEQTEQLRQSFEASYLPSPKADRSAESSLASRRLRRSQRQAGRQARGGLREDRAGQD